MLHTVIDPVYATDINYSNNDFELIYSENLNKRRSFDRELIYPFDNPFTIEELYE